jgi:argininosuccinate synthase
VDIVESRFVGMKSRGVYETPGGTILLHAHRAIESICLDRGELHLKVGPGPHFSDERISSLLTNNGQRVWWDGVVGGVGGAGKSKGL